MSVALAPPPAAQVAVRVGLAPLPGPVRRPRVGLVGFEAAVATWLGQYLGRVGMEAVSLGLGPSRLQAVDMAVVSVRDPRQEAARWVEAFRQRLGVPLVLVCRRPCSAQRVAALRAGADDLVAAPFSPSELSLRLRAIWRRMHGVPPMALRGPGYPAIGWYNGSSAEEAGAFAPELLSAPGGPPPGDAEPVVVRAGGLVVDRAARAAYLDGVMLDLTAREFELLWLLASRPGWVVSREAIWNQLWDDGDGSGPDSVTVLVSRLRRKLRRAPRSAAGPDGPGLRVSQAYRIRALWGVGYRLEVHPA